LLIRTGALFVRALNILDRVFKAIVRLAQTGRRLDGAVVWVGMLTLTVFNIVTVVNFKRAPSPSEAMRTHTPQESQPLISAWAGSVDNALSVLPLEFRGAATVLGWNGYTPSIPVRVGNNPYVCLLDNPLVPGIRVNCVLKDDLELLTRYEQLRLFLDEAAVLRILDGEIRIGTLREPVRGTGFHLMGDDWTSSHRVVIISEPYATARRAFCLSAPTCETKSEMVLILGGTRFARYVLAAPLDATSQNGE
jgi:hypothetical protein